MAHFDIKSEKLIKNKPVACYSCGDAIKNSSMLVCADCLDRECEDFEKLTDDADLDIAK